MIYSVNKKVKRGEGTFNILEMPQQENKMSLGHQW